MANFQAYNDRVWNLPLESLNPNTGTTGSWPSGVSAAAVSSLPNSLAVGIGAPANLIMTPKVQNSTGISVTVSGTGMTSATFLVDVVTDPNAPLQVVIDAASATSTGQAVPSAPGP